VRGLDPGEDGAMSFMRTETRDQRQLRLSAKHVSRCEPELSFEVGGGVVV
jgi:hypothetical protein